MPYFFLHPPLTVIEAHKQNPKAHLLVRSDTNFAVAVYEGSIDDLSYVRKDYLRLNPEISNTLLKWKFTGVAKDWEPEGELPRGGVGRK